MEKIEPKKSKIKFKKPYLKCVKFESFLIGASSRIADINFNTNVKLLSNGNNAIVTLVVEIPKKDDKTSYSILVEYESLFTWDSDVDNVMNYLKVNASALLYSYIRPVVSFLTVLSNNDRVDLPFMDFTSLQKS